MHPRPCVYKSILMRKLRDELIDRYEDKLENARWPVPKFITNKPYETNRRTHRTPNHPNTILHHSKHTISEETPTSDSSPSPPR